MNKSLFIFLMLSSFSLTVYSNTNQTNSFPIEPGKVGPVAPGNPQYPFLCATVNAGLGNPIIDNQLERGTPVKDSGGKIIGYSEFCGSPMTISYFYKPTKQDTYLPLPKNETGKYYYPSNLDVTISGNKYIVRVERGTVNRFMYMIAVLQDPVANKTPQESGYKSRAIFNFQGGIGVGYSQASNSAARIIQDPHRLIQDLDPITLGYAVLYTTGNATSIQYNLKLALETAKMVKQQLVAEFGPVSYTLAFGSSGGAVQQYVFAQLDPHLIDGILALASYGDFITQTIYASDCALLEYYFDNQAIDKPTPWAKRQLIEGFAASTQMPAGKLSQLNPKTVSIRSPDGKFGSDTCMNGWGGAVPNVMNPRYPTVEGIGVIKISKPIDWSEWGSESNQWQFGTYPTTSENVTPNTVDNTGIQYGLSALKSGDIDKATFFDLNKKVGGWKSPEQFQPEDGFPMSGPDKTYDGWSSKNATAATAAAEGRVAARKEGDANAIDAAEKSNTVLEGNLEIPMLDVKSDQEEEGNMHSLIHSFVTRARLQKHGKAGNQVIWIARLEDKLSAENSALQTMSLMGKSQIKNLNLQPNSKLSNKLANIALVMMQDWVERNKQHPERTVAENKPSYLKDGCYYKAGLIPRFGDDVWDGVIDPTQGKGFCTKHFSIHPTPHMAAGRNILGQTFRCNLVDVDNFIAQGGYGKIVMSDADVVQLKTIFPLGVCSDDSLQKIK